MEVGNPPISYQNNAFFIVIINSLLFGVELKLKPFGIPQLNSLNFIANFITIITIFGGLFSSINQQTILSLILMIIIMCMNIYFMLLFLKCFIQIRLSFIEKQNILTKWLNKFYTKFWPSGLNLFWLRYYSFIIYRISIIAAINQCVFENTFWRKIKGN